MNADYLDNQKSKLNCYPLEKIVDDFQILAKGKTLVFHSAHHDLRILRQSFKKVNKHWPNRLSVQCTFRLSQKYFPGLESYSLAQLSRNLNLKVSDQYFNRNMAHTAKYDAEFTYQLYRKIMLQATLYNTLKNQPNPFSSSRVDTPFQNHPDLKDIYEDEFRMLKSALFDIKGDLNCQSHGVVVTGEPGSGKTHLMMRLAKETLKTNRLLFIRQPNNDDSILFHIYSRILESLVEPVPGSKYNQLQYLLANSIVRFLQEANIGGPLSDRCKDNPLKLYDSMGREGTDVRRRNWDRLIKQIRPWWMSKYGGAAYSWSILQGLMHYCRYSDEGYKFIITRWLAGASLDVDDLDKVKLDQWDDELNREAFSLEAIAVLSKLSLLDEPLIIIFDQLEGLGRKQNRVLLENFGEAIKEIFTHVPNSLIIFNLFPNRWIQMRDEIFDGAIIDRMSQYIVQLECPSQESLKAILQEKLNSLHVQLETLFDNRELDDILGQSSIRSVINRAAAYYRHKLHGVILPPQSRQQLVDSNVIESSQLTSALNNTTEYRLDRIEADIRSLKEELETLFSNQPPGTVPTSEKTLLEEQIVDPDIDMLTTYLEQQRKELDVRYDKPCLIDDNDDLGKLLTITGEITNFELFDIQELRLGKSKLPEHLLIQNSQRGNVLAFLHVGGVSFTARIRNFNLLTISHPNFSFILMRDVRESKIKGKVGKSEIEKLNHTRNGKFVYLQREDRIELELIYKLVVDIQNQDLDISIEKAFSLIRQHQPKHWILEMLFLQN
nr:exonuclease domain-containing protein [Adonisia turfae]